jgi:hypothetical protein
LEAELELQIDCFVTLTRQPALFLAMTLNEDPSYSRLCELRKASLIKRIIKMERSLSADRQAIYLEADLALRRDCFVTPTHHPALFLAMTLNEDPSYSRLCELRKASLIKRIIKMERSNLFGSRIGITNRLLRHVKI